MKDEKQKCSYKDMEMTGGNEVASDALRTLRDAIIKDAKPRLRDTGIYASLDWLHYQSWNGLSGRLPVCWATAPL